MRSFLFKSIVTVTLLSSVTFAQKIYKQVGSYNLPGESGWDYLTFDSVGQRLFVTHGTSILVVDPQGKTLGEFPANGAHGVALVQDQNLGFSTNGKAATVTVFDLKTLKPIQDIKVSEGPDAIIYDGNSKHVLVMHGRSRSLEAINPSTKQLDATVPDLGKLEFAAAEPGKVYVNVEDKGEIAVIDSSTWKLVTRWKLDGCEEPGGLDIDVKNHVLFSACGNSEMMVVDTTSGKVLATVKTGDGTDAAAFDPGTGYAFASNGADANITVIKKNGSTWTVAENISTMKSARTMALDPKTHNLYTVGADFEPPPPGERRGKMKPGSFRLLVYQLAQ